MCLLLFVENKKPAKCGLSQEGVLGGLFGTVQLDAIIKQSKSSIEVTQGLGGGVVCFIVWPEAKPRCYVLSGLELSD